MADYIDRQAAVSICDNAIDLWNGLLGAGALVAVRDAIKALPSAERHGKWIPCKERLPDDGVNVLVQFIDGYTEICRLLGGCWEVLYGEYTGIHTAVAWMPLPEPYKGGN